MLAAVNVTAAEADTSAVIYVALNGNDSAGGTIESPLRTFGGAQAAVKKLKSAGVKDIDVVFREGEYRLSSSVTFGADDGAENGHLITYRSMDGENAVFKGSREFDSKNAQPVTSETALARIKDSVKNHIVSYDLAKMGFSKNDITDLSNIEAQIQVLDQGEPNFVYVNGVEQTIAQWPDGDGVYSHWDSAEDGRTIHFTENDPTRWTTAANDWWLGTYATFDYCYARMSGKSVNPEKHTLTAADLNNLFYFTSYQSRRWKAFNLLEELDTPGEFYVDREKMILYLYPPYGLKDAKTELSFLTRPMISLRETQNVLFKNITLSQTCGDGFRMVDVKNVDIKGCKLENIAQFGVFIDGSKNAVTDSQYWQIQRIDASYDCDIADSTFNNIGASAIKMTGGNLDTLTPANNVIDNNMLYRCSQITKNKNAIEIGGCGITVTHNNISRCAFQGVYYLGNSHTISYNEIYDVIQETDDCGAIYCGRNSLHQGNVISYNYLHDLFSTEVLPFGHQTAIYWDDNMVGQTAHNNIINGVRKNAYSNGIDIHFYNNTSINITAASMDFKNGGAATNNNAGGVGFGSNIADEALYFKKYPNLPEIIELMAQGTPAELSKFSEFYNNLDVNAPANIIGTYNREFAKVKNNVNMQVCDDFVNPEKQDYRIKRSSPTAKRIPGITTDEFDIEEIGLQRDVNIGQETSSFKQIFPANGQQALPSSEVKFKWENAFGSSKYKLMIATDRDMKNIVYEDDAVPYNITSVKGLKNNTVYYWKVAAYSHSRELAAEWESESGVYTFSTGIYEPLDKSYYETIVPNAIKASEKAVEGNEVGNYPIGTKNKFNSMVKMADVAANARLGMFSQINFDKLVTGIGEFYSKKGMVNKGVYDMTDVFNNPEMWSGDATVENGIVSLKSDPSRAEIYSMSGTSGLDTLTGSVIYSFDAKIHVTEKFVGLGFKKYIDMLPYQNSNTGYDLIINSEAIELQYSNGTAHDILESVPYTFDDEFHRFDFGFIDIPCGTIVILNIDGKKVIEYRDIIDASVNALCNMEIMIFNDVEAGIELRKNSTPMTNEQYEQQLKENIYRSAKVLVDGIDSGYNERTKFAVFKKDSNKVFTDDNVTDISECGCKEINGALTVEVSKLAEIINAQITKEANGYKITKDNATALIAENDCTEYNGKTMLPLIKTAEALGISYSEDAANNILIFGNIVVMNNIKILTKMSALMDILTDYHDGLTFEY